MMYGQLAGIESLRELVDIIAVPSPKSYNLGFGKGEIKLINLVKANTNRDNHIFEEFTYKLVAIAQRKRINPPFELNGRFYAFDSTTKDLSLRDFWLTFFRKIKSGIKVHTLFDVVTQIPTYFNNTAANK